MKRVIFYFLLFFIITLEVGGQGTTNDSTMISRELQEVVIKASKDNVTYKNIPASVSVIPTNVIEDNEIRSLTDLSATAPNFFMPEYGSKLTSPVYIRGIGSRINSPSVGLYVDYVPYFEKAAFDFDFFDINKIEVLRGPQGTLFGRNTMGGIINIVTTSPMDYQGTHLNISAGNYGAYSINTGHYGKAGEKLGYSIALNSLHNDGFYTNEYTGSKVDKLNSFGLRNRVIYEISPHLTIENIAGYELSMQGGYPYAVYVDSLFASKPINYNQYSTYKRNLFSDALLLRYSGEDFEIMSTTSYQFLDDAQDIDQDFTSDSLFFVVQKQHQNMISQEVIARSSGSKKYKWLFGGYFFHQQFDNAVDVNAYAQSMPYLKTYDHRITGAALFHQSTLADFPIKNVTLTAGLRVDTEEDLMDYFYDRTLRGVYSIIADTTYPSLKSLEIIPRFALNYQLKNSNFYAVVARGYKTGGFNSTFERPEDLTFNSEYSWNYEAGIKTSFFNEKLKTDAALFYIDWDNQQIYQTVPSGRGSMLKNAGNSVSKGAELSVSSNPFKGLDLTISYGYTDARFVTYKLNETVNYDNNYIPYVPRHTISIQAGKTFEINSNVIDKLKVLAIYRGAGKIYWEEENTFAQPYYGLLDAKISFSRNNVQFDFWTKNILNEDYYSFYFTALGNKYVQTSKPLQFGVNLGLKF
ncbi:MAG TPA: TonB-dependent receptor [Bacteroidales bacterium]|nr:TonB-dependent receptor [Bacteroidales bacterium]